MHKANIYVPATSTTIFSPILNKKYRDTLNKRALTIVKSQEESNT